MLPREAFKTEHTANRYPSLFVFKLLDMNKVDAKRSYHSIALCLLLSMTFVLRAFSQEVKVSGRVTDKAGQGLVSALVQVSGREIRTDRYGAFELRLKPGNYRFLVRYPAYERQAALRSIRSDTTIAFVLLRSTQLSEIVITASRADAHTPIAYTDVPRETLEKRNLGQDIPQLLNFTPSIVTTSDAGAGVGYTNMRIRGSDSRSINISIDGVPLNDAESQAVYWVDLPDIASSTASIQIQRGAGTSTDGAGAFGASIELLTEKPSDSASLRFSNAFGSFNTHKHTLSFSSGKLSDHFYFEARGSIIKSDGYIDRATSDLKSYYTSTTYKNGKSALRLLAFGGHEKTYQAWNGIDAKTRQTDRTYNRSGLYTDQDGKTKFYDNEIDWYDQYHYQLHFTHRFGRHWKLNAALHYTYGRGYYESYKQDQPFAKYGFQTLESGGKQIDTTDVIQRKWLDNHFYGSVFSLRFSPKSVQLVLGGGWNRYQGAHFGDVQWARYASQSHIRDRFYDNEGIKTDANLYLKANYQLSEKINAYADAQIRHVGYRIQGTDERDTGAKPIEISDTLFFFNPKAGLTYAWDRDNTLYASYARANREPSRTDYKAAAADHLPKHERLDDFEWGWRHKSKRLSLEANGFYMQYSNQLVRTGELDAVGNPIRTNSGESYRLGIELSTSWMFAPRWRWTPNLTLSRNRNQHFIDTKGDSPKALGSTILSFSPSVIAGQVLEYKPLPKLSLSWYSKYVGAQYLDNTQAKNGRLDPFWVNDFGATFSFEKWGFKPITLSFLLNNFLDVKYVSNGALYDGVPYYYPQAGRHFLMGISLSL